MHISRNKAGRDRSARSKPNARHSNHESSQVHTPADEAARRADALSIAHAPAQLALNSLTRLVSHSAELNAETKSWVASAPPGKARIQRILLATRQECELLRLLDQQIDIIIGIPGKVCLLVEAATNLSTRPGEVNSEEQDVQEWTERLAEVCVRQHKIFNLPMPKLDD